MTTAQPHTHNQPDESRTMLYPLFEMALSCNATHMNEDVITL